MTTFSLVNQKVSTGAEAFYYLKSTLSGSGPWTVLSSSNGATAQEGDIWTSTSAVTSSYSWTVLKHNASSHHLLFQRSNDGSPYTNGTIKMLSGSITLGTGDATTAPTAATGSWINFGTDVQWFDNMANEQAKLYIVGQSTGEFWLAAVRMSTAVPYTSFIFERFTNTNALDNDQFGFRPVFASEANRYDYLCGANGLYSSLSGTFGAWNPGVLTWANGQQMWATSIPANTLTGKIEALAPIMYRDLYSGVAPHGVKGLAATLKFGSHPSFRKVGTILDMSGSKSHVCMQTYYGFLTTILPWDGTSDWVL